MPRVWAIGANPRPGATRQPESRSLSESTSTGPGLTEIKAATTNEEIIMIDPNEVPPPPSIQISAVVVGMLGKYD